MAAGGRRRNGRIFILLAIILIVILAVAGFFLRNQLFPSQQIPGQPLATPTPNQAMSRIVVLAQPVARGTTITEGMVAVVPYPQDQLVEGLFYTDVQTVIGKRARFDLEQGVPLTASLVTDAPEGSYASFQIPRGLVAVSIPMSRLTAVSYALQPGDHVNIIGSMLLVDLDTDFQSRLPNYTAAVIAPGPSGGGEETGGGGESITITINGSESPQGRAELDTALNQAVYVQPSESQRPRLVSQTLVQDAIVLWVGEFPLNGSAETQAQAAPTATPAAGEPAQAPTRPDVVTLVVTPQDAVTLNYLMLVDAHLSLALRSAGDDQRVPTETVTLQFILDQYNIPYPAKLPYGIEPRIDDLYEKLPSQQSAQP
ncbi:MAG: Flp pilus assembly protein CpaB [Chloroflexi bacterium]|jgi:Flp pilus assembly protein CpaB|nr:Flp pilus assembly protein CpaB [Anaerolineaceae bacterium]NMB87664.1 Flp pilus assembly protein CpaB [Chloroflexota bacterium]